VTPPGPAVTPGPALAAVTCRGCGTPGARLAVDLGDQPAADDFPSAAAPGPDERRPLQLWWCPRCALVQLGPVEPMGEEPVRAVESRTSREHARRTVTALLAERPALAGRTVREFASHHGGSWLEALAGHGVRPAADGEPADLVVDVHALAHEQHVEAALAARAGALAPGGLLVVEFHHLLPLLEQGQFDTIRHGHWSYLSLTALARLAERHGLRPVHAVVEPVFGGSLRVLLAARPSGGEAPQDVDPSVDAVLAAERAAGLDTGSGLEPFAVRAREAAAELHAFLVAERQAGRRVLGYGAPSKAATLLGLAGVGPDLLAFTVDAAPLKHGLAIPGVRVPIRPVPALAVARPDSVLVLTWDIADEVMSQLEADGGWGARYVLPLPTPTVLAARPRPAPLRSGS